MKKSWSRLGDRALVRAFEGSAEEANARAIAAWRAIAADVPDEVADVVPAARSVTVVLHDGAEPGARLLDFIDAEYAPDESAGAAHVIPATYDGEDLDEVAAMCGMTAAEVIELHAAGAYTVAFVGFSPGFGYLRGLAPELHVARRDAPRTRVPAGSIAIAGPWTGVYPTETPGGWRLIGHTDLSLFDPARGALLRPGDRVRFAPARR